jgi:D-lyxose ketol-isomerase
MITKEQYAAAVKRTLQYFDWAGIRVTDEEKKRIEVADFGLSDLDNIGLQILTYVNTDRVCAKELVLFPYQSCPEHKHVGGAAGKGKEETFRCRRGKVFLYVEGAKTADIKARPINSKTTVYKEIELNEGGQYTLPPETWHWFQGGAEGAVVSEFSTKSSDETDIFTDPEIKRSPRIKE